MDSPNQSAGRLVLDSDRMRLRWVGAGVPEDAEAWDQVAMQLKQIALRQPLMIEDVQQILTEATPADDGVYDVVLARGTPTVAPVHGELVWAKDFFAQGYLHDEHGRIDYRARVLPPGVDQGELVVTITPAVEGTPGTDLMGTRLKPERPRRPKLKVGKGCHVEDGAEGEKRYLADVRGRVRLEGETLHVDDLLVISGDVDLEIGHLHHSGAIEIGGDVQPGFIIEAEGDILIRGLVQQSDVRCGGNLVVEGGIHGAGTQPIVAGGSIRAKYLTECSVVATGAVEVELEAVQATVHTAAEFLCPTGRVVGGEIFARRGMTVAQVGSEGGISTRLIAGLDESAMANYAASQAELARHVENHARMKTAITRAQMVRANLTPPQREALTELMFQITELETAINDERTRGERLQYEIQAFRAVEIRVLAALYAETQLQIGDKAKRLISEALKGPLVARFYDGQVMLRQLTE